jgi:hypothetical protein
MLAPKDLADFKNFSSFDFRLSLGSQVAIA